MSLTAKTAVGGSSPAELTGLSNGTHTFKVRAVVVPGNTTPATYTWTVDTLKPTITPLAPKSDSTITDTTPTIKANVKDGARQLIPGGKVSLFVSGTQIPAPKFTYGPVTGSLTYNSPKLSKGKKQVKIVATDAAGNTSSKVWYFTIR